VSDPQKTQKPTPKRIRDFRRRGEIALSRDVVSTATLAGGAIMLVACSSMAFSALASFTRDAALASDGAPTANLAHTAAHTFLVATAPALIGALVAAILAILGQLGWPPAWKGIGFDLSRISPFKNVVNIFAPSAIIRRSGTAIAKVVLVGAIVALALGKGLDLHPMQAGSVIATASSLIGRVLGFVIGALVVLAAIDYYLSHRRIAAQMRMSPDEAKREHREQDGDPQVKGRRRSKMKEMAKRRIAVAVAKADVVVVNPTHYAVALRYDDKSDRAPLVVAKGVDEVAEKIREVARKHGVPILARPPLARALHKAVKEGRPIPANLYRAVAEVLAYVYRLRRGVIA
jgi:flagellar biosynthetic protein FlhB